ncbi:thermonuclease family protein [Clostridium sp. MD294]|uniref:thermonuclease family protein n=1 Tax=Clostridium sp. MD294 TaxID=97138 RepID=UPI0002C98426|nr:thermonuclease family protein [Clostridium sp. MD294]NDO47168.1 thermonuclease family protein [Clostridium sp. MD294]USF29768.1 hypothetical protein C820_001176 [Clostridium sp. MD294]
MKWKNTIAVLLSTVLFCFGILTGCDDINDINIEDIAIEDVETQDIIVEDETIEYADANNEEIETVEVASVVDGDTIKVYLEGERYTIRMIGIDTPESVHPDETKNTIYGQKASDYAKQTIEKGQIVYLSKDVSDRDKYDRLLRYVWLEKPVDVNDENEIREKMYNAKVVLDGYANVYEYAPNNTLYDLFLSFEAEAEQNNRGLWAENGLNTENIERAEAQKEAEEDIFIGNKNSKKLHSSYCTDLPQEKNRIYFDSKEEAIEQGYEVDSRCIK